MPEGRWPGAEWMPGESAGYSRGQTVVRSVVAHFTVGRNSTAIGLRGYYNFQVNRDGSVYQFAEADAVCWHAGSPWNSLGPGIEVEYLPGYDDELFTPEAYHSTALLCQWLHDEWGVPLDFYDGPRIVAHAGFITHRSLIQTGDAHSDWWPELPRVTGPPAPPVPVPLEETGMRLFKDKSSGVWALWTGINWVENVPELRAFTWLKGGIPGEEIEADALQALRVVVGEHVESLVQRIAVAVK